MATPIELILRLTGIQSVVNGLGATATALDGISASARRTGQQLQQIGNSIAGFGTRLTAGVTAPLALATTGLVRMAAEAVESENLFEVSMGGMADAAREFSEGLRSELGLNAFELRRQIGIMQNFTTAMGVAEETAYEMSTGVASLAADMASFFNITTEEAFRRIQSGLSGEIEPLRRLGIVVSDAQVQAAAAAMGLTGELSDQQKVLIRYNLILQQTQNAQGDLARTIDSPANAMRILGAQFEQLAIELGTAFLPTVRNVVIAIRDNIVPVLQNWIEAFSNLEPRTRGFIVLAGAAVAAIGPLALAVGGLITVVGTLVTVLGFLVSPIVVAIAALGAIAAAVYFARDSFDNIGNAITEIGGLMSRLAATAFRPVINGISDLIGVAGQALDILGRDGLAREFQAAADGMRALGESGPIDAAGAFARAGGEIGTAWEDARGNFDNAVSGITSTVTGLADFLGGEAESATESTAAMGEGLVELGRDSIESANALGAASGSISNSINQITASVGAFLSSGESERTVSDVFREWQEGFENMESWGVQAAEGLTESFDRFTTSLSDGIGDAVGRAIVFGESFQEAIGNVAKKAVAELISSLVSLGVQYVLNATLAQALAGVMTAFATAQAQLLAAAWAPAAALASLASFGANAGPANAALAGTVAFAQGLAAFQHGTDSFTATGPRLIMVGENGPERVSVNPLSAGGSGRSGGGITFNIYDSIIDDQSLDTLVDVLLTRAAERGQAIV